MVVKMKVRDSDGLTNYDISGVSEDGMKLLVAALDRMKLNETFCKRMGREVGVVPAAVKQFYRNLSGQLTDAIERRKQGAD